jgi:two-component system heavy metal sensor histidine kinase CusS
MSSKPAREPARPWSIASRLTVWYTAAAFVLVLTATGYQYFALARNLDREDDQFLIEKVRAVRRVLEDHPGDRAAIAEQVATEGESEESRFLIRVSFTGRAEDAVESPGMAQVLPWTVFPSPGAGTEGEVSEEHETADGRAFRLRSYQSESTPAVIQVAMNTSHDDEILEDYRRRLSYVLGLSLIAAAAGGYWIARRGVRPIADVIATARRIRPAHLDERIATDGQPAEIRELAGTFNHMLDRLKDAFTRLGRFSADIAHELRTPVNNLRGGAEVALGRPRTPEEYREALGSCLEECGRLTRLIDSLLFLARAEDPKTELVAAATDVAAELRTVAEFFAPAAAEAGVRLEVQADPGLVVRADRHLLQQAVGNLVANALAHTPAGGTVTLFAGRDAAGVPFGVRDTGPGIPAEHLPYLFDRFYRADPARTADRGRVGLGLGLAIVKGIAELHHGRVTAASAPGQGTTVTLTLPPGKE